MSATLRCVRLLTAGLLSTLVVATGAGAATLPGAPPSALAQSSADQPATPEHIVDIRVHGNHTTPDADVLRIAGVSVGDPFSDALANEVAARLERSGRFRSVDVRKRFASISDPSQVVLVIVIEERVGVSVEGPPGPLRRLGASTMWLPVVGYEDGYGWTYGVRFAFVDLLGRRTHLAVPLTWGGERRASAEVAWSLEHGPLTRVMVQGGIARRENPAFNLPDTRDQASVLAEHAFASWARVSGIAQVAHVHFGDEDQRFASAGVVAVLDTRRDPVFPRNAVYAAATWEHLWFDVSPDTWRQRLDVRGYVGLIGQSVLVLRAQQSWADSALPGFEQALLGGIDSLRGYRAGFKAGDRLAAVSGELRLPISSPLRVGRAGLAAFVDSGTTYSASQSLGGTRFDTGVGGGFFVTATVFSFRIDVAKGLDAGTRAHVALGLTF